MKNDDTKVEEKDLMLYGNENVGNGINKLTKGQFKFLQHTMKTIVENSRDLTQDEIDEMNK